MTNHKLLTCFATSFGIWLICLYLIAVWHAEISTTVVGTYALIGVCGLTSLVWPIFAILLLRKAGRQALLRFFDS